MASIPWVGQKLASPPSALSVETPIELEDGASRERDKLIVRLLADTGIRLGELIGMRPESVIDRDGRQYLHVTGKAQRGRLVPLTPILYERLRRYSGATRQSRLTTTHLFRAARRTAAGRIDRFGPSGVTQMVSTLGKVAGIKKRVYPHLFRHSFATWALGQGMYPVQLKDILGHSSERPHGNNGCRRGDGCPRCLGLANPGLWHPSWESSKPASSSSRHSGWLGAGWEGGPATTGSPSPSSASRYLRAVTGTTIGPCSTDGAENA